MEESVDAVSALGVEIFRSLETSWFQYGYSRLRFTHRRLSRLALR